MVGRLITDRTAPATGLLTLRGICRVEIISNEVPAQDGRGVKFPMRGVGRGAARDTTRDSAALARPRARAQAMLVHKVASFGVKTRQQGTLWRQDGSIRPSLLMLISRFLGSWGPG